MPIHTTHTRAVAGNDIHVSIDAPTGKLISSVTCTLDGGDLYHTHQPTGESSSSHEHLQVGSAGPNYAHTLIVKVYYDDSTTEKTSDEWNDPF